MNSLLISGVVMTVAALIAVAATPLFGAVATRSGLMVQPQADRWHRSATPLLGGAGIGVAVLVALVASLPLDRVGIAVLLAAVAALVLGLTDDFRRMAPTSKLVGQVLIGGGLVLAGVRVEIIGSPPVAFLLTVFWVVAMMNALNLMDNMDGLAAGLAVIAGVVLAITSLPESPIASIVAAATAGAALGFLVHNFPPARIFMGDAGSLLLGLLLATAALLHTASSAANLGLALLAPLVALGLPIFDTVFVMVSRVLSGVPISRGGRDHTSHRLAALGLSDRAVVLTLYVVGATLALMGVLAESLTHVVIPLVAVAAIALVLFAVFLGVEASPRRDVTVGQQAQVLRNMTVLGRYGLEVGIDVGLLTIAYFASFLVRFEGVSEEYWMGTFVRSVPLVVGTQLAALVVMRVYRSLWRYFVIADALAIVRAISVGTALAVVAILIVYRFEGHSRAVFAIDWLFAAVLIVGARSFSLTLRQLLARIPRPDDHRVLIVGANDGGAIALRLLERIGEVRYRPVGFLDDDPGKRYRRVAGVPIVGTVADIDDVLARLNVDVVVLASEETQVVSRVRSACERAGVPCRDFVPTV